MGDNMHMPRFLAAMAVLTFMTGCGSSPPTHFYTLDPVPPAHAPGTMAAGPAVQVVAVHIPAALDRQEMVQESGGHALSINGQNRWGAPFAEMARRVLTQDLVHRLPAGRVVFPKQAARPGTVRLVVDILQFAGDGGGQVVFDAGWSLLPPDSDTPLLNRHVHLTETASPADYAGQAGAMSAILGKLADQVTAAIGRLPAGPASSGNATTQQNQRVQQ